MITGNIFPETTRSFANRNNAIICINAGVSWSEYRGNKYYNEYNQKCNKMHGLRVYNHMLVSNDIESNWYKKTHWALGITDEGLLEVCGCPKDKCKEYAEYCRKYMEEFDAKKKKQ